MSLITHGRDDSTLRDHPDFSRNITQAHKLEGLLTSLWSTGPGEKKRQGTHMWRKKTRIWQHVCVLSQ